MSIKLLFLLAGVLALAYGQTIRLPPPTGKHSVGHSHYRYTDNSRPEPFNKTIRRSIMVHHLFPIPKVSPPSDTAYGPAPVLRALEQMYSVPPFTLDKIRGNSHWRPVPKSKPTIIFSHGMGTSVVISSTLLEELASHGYNIVAIDHPYDAAAVTYPDGETVLAVDSSNFTIAEIEKMLLTRVEDVGFVIKKFGIEKAVVLGHSLGGATAVDAARRYPKVIVGASDMDGMLFNTKDAAKKKVFLFSTAIEGGHPEWETFEGNHKGWVKHAKVNGFTHASFTDLGWLAKVLNVPDAIGFVGTSPGLRQIEIVRRFMRDFAEFALYGQSGKLVNGEGKGFPEVVFEEDDHGH